MTDQAEKPLEEMSTFELEKEIGDRTRRFNINVQFQTGRTSVTALAIDRKHPAVVEVADSAEVALRRALRKLRAFGYPAGLTRL